MRIFLTGVNGQVGWELNRALLPHAEVYASDVDTLDLLDEPAVRASIRALKPDVIINTAAYTAVDRAEKEHRELCMKLNGQVPGMLAEEAERVGAWMVHYSTDYVFNGRNGTPQTEEDEPDPINFYGESKLAGDMSVMKNASKHLIFRVSWVYASRGKNFVRTMMNMFNSKREISVVDDQIGTPTWARFIADTTVMAVAKTARVGDAPRAGLYNLVPDGVTTWFRFAREIAKYMNSNCTLKPIASSDYLTPAERPARSILSTEKIKSAFNLSHTPWETCMKLCLDEIEEAGRL